MPINIEDLLDRVRYLVVVVADIEPNRVRDELDALTAAHGHALIAATLTAVAPARYPALASEENTPASRSAADESEQAEAGRHDGEGLPERPPSDR